MRMRQARMVTRLWLLVGKHRRGPDERRRARRNINEASRGLVAGQAYQDNANSRLGHQVARSTY